MDKMCIKHTYDESDTCFDCGHKKPEPCHKHWGGQADPDCSLCTKINKPNSTNRVLKHRQEAKEQGRKRKEYLVSDDEHVQIKALLKDMRA